MIRAAGAIELFNPRLREGGDPVTFCSAKRSKFSIHASAKEATQAEAALRKNMAFSIHASAKEATVTSPELYAVDSFSIHASAKEATMHR